MSLEQAKKLLEEVGVEVAQQSGALMLKFKDADKSRIVGLFAPDHTGYFTLVSIIAQVDVQKLDRAKLLELWAISSQVRLSKLELMRNSEDENNALVIASSECAVESPSGEKLRRRAQACAELAKKAAEILNA